MGLAQWASGDLHAAYQTLADAGVGFQKAGNFHFALSVTYGLGDIRTVQGRLHDAVKIYERASQLAMAQDDPFPRGVADLYLGLGELAYAQGDLDTALRQLQHSEQLGEAAGLSDWRYRMCRVQAHMEANQGNLARALDLLDAAEHHHRPTPVPDVRPLAAMKARVWLAQGRLSDALRWVQERGLSTGDELSFLREYEHITLARLLMVQAALQPRTHTIGAATQLLERLLQAAEAGGRMGSAIEIGVLQAVAHENQGDLPAALRVLEPALRRAEPEGYVRIFVDEGPPMMRLLTNAAAHGILPHYCGRLLAASGTMNAARLQPPKPPLFSTSAVQPLAGPLAGPPAGPLAGPLTGPLTGSLIEPLSARELEILHLIAQGLSNEAIGAQLFLALSTIKGHNRNIFGKLQVQSRTEAVARARVLGLL